MKSVVKVPTIMRHPARLQRATGASYYFKRPNMHKFIELMSNDDTKTVYNLANFVFKSLFNSKVSYGYLNLICFV